MSDAIGLPTPYAAAMVAEFLAEHLSWSAFWDKRAGVWRVAENDPDSDLLLPDVEDCDEGGVGDSDVGVL